MGYVCSDCGADHSEWQGQCTDCGAWNTLQEFVVSSSKNNDHPPRYQGYAGQDDSSGIQMLSDVNLAEVPRFSSGMLEFDRVLGGGWSLFLLLDTTNSCKVFQAPQ